MVHRTSFEKELPSGEFSSRRHIATSFSGSWTRLGKPGQPCMLYLYIVVFVFSLLFSFCSRTRLGRPGQPLSRLLSMRMPLAMVMLEAWRAIRTIGNKHTHTHTHVHTPPLRCHPDRLTITSTTSMPFVGMPSGCSSDQPRVMVGLSGWSAFSGALTCL